MKSVNRFNPGQEFGSKYKIPGFFLNRGKRFPGDSTMKRTHDKKSRWNKKKKKKQQQEHPSSLITS